MPDDAFPAWWIALTIAFVPLAVWLAIRDIRRQRQVVRDWAAANHVTLMRRLPAWYRVSPFLAQAIFGGHQSVEYWLVKDSVGIERRVWLKIGSFFRGTTREISAEWE